MVTIEECEAIHPYFERAMRGLFLKRQWDRNSSGFLNELIERVQRAVPSNFYGLDKAKIKIVVTFVFDNHERVTDIDRTIDTISGQINHVWEKLKKENGYDLDGYFARLDYVQLIGSFQAIREIENGNKDYFFKIDRKKINIKKFQLIFLMHKVGNLVFPNHKFESESLYQKMINQNPALANGDSLIFSVQEINNRFAYHIKLAKNYLKEIKSYQSNLRIFDAVEHAEISFPYLKNFWDKILEVSRKLNEVIKFQAEDSKELKVYEKQVDFIRYEFGNILAEIGSYRTASINKHFEKFEGELNSHFDRLYQTLKFSDSLTTKTMFKKIFKEIKKIFQGKKIKDYLLCNYLVERFQQMRKKEFHDFTLLHPNLDRLTNESVDHPKNPTFNHALFENIAGSIYFYKMGDEYSALNIKQWKKNVFKYLGAFVDEDLSCVFENFEIPLIFSYDEKIWDSLKEIYEQINNKIPKKIKAKGKKIKGKKIKGNNTIKTTDQLFETIFRKLKRALKDDQVFEEELKEYALIFLKKTRCEEVRQLFEKNQITNDDIKRADLTKIVLNYISAQNPSALNIKEFEKELTMAFGAFGAKKT